MKQEREDTEYKTIVRGMVILATAIVGLATYEATKPQFDFSARRVTYVVPGDSEFTARITYIDGTGINTLVDQTGELAYFRDAMTRNVK